MSIILKYIMAEIDFDVYYSRHFPLSSIGKENQLKLKYKTVLVVGLGGLGTVSSNLLVSLGVGNLKLVDFDTVEATNLARQHLYTQDDIGHAKVVMAARRLRKRNPHVKIEEITMKVDALNAESLLNNVDLVIDALDRFVSRKALYRAAFKKKIPFLFAGAVADNGNLMTFTQKTDDACLYCVLGDVEDNDNMRCEFAGVNPLILHLVAGFQVNEALRILTGKIPFLSKKMKIIDLISGSIDDIGINKNPDCTLCGSRSDELDQGKPGETTKGLREIEGFGQAIITSLCGRNTFVFDPKWIIDWRFKDVIAKVKTNFEVKTVGDNYISFMVDKTNISLVDSGVATLRGLSTSREAIELIQKVFTNIA